jgi:uncharacterized protein
MRALGYIAFFAVALGIVGGVHWYIWARLFRDPTWPAWVRVAGGAVLAVLAVSLPLGMIFWRVMPGDTSRWLSTALFIWMGTGFYFLVALFAVDLAKWILGPFIEDPERRRLLTDGAVKIAGVAAAGASVAALRSGLGEVEVKEVNVELERLPKQLDGLTLVQLSDVHVGPTIGRKFIEAIVEKVNAQKADAVVITGDLVDGSVRDLEESVAALGKLSARYGVYFVTGNHEYYSGVREWSAHLKKLGIKVLSNDRAAIGDQVSIDLAGIDDITAHRITGAADFGLGAALRNRDPERELVLLSHQPKTIVEAAKHGVGLQLSGHTHGGQIQPFGALVSLTQPYMAGLYRHDEKTQIYVSRGTGFWGPPMRLFAPAEVTKIVLGARA